MKPLGFAALVLCGSLSLSPSTAFPAPSGSGSIRWCLTDGNGNSLCCGPWHDYGTGLNDDTYDQANRAAWRDFLNSGCPGVTNDGSDPPYVVAGSGGATVDSTLHVGNLGPTGNDGLNFSFGASKGWSLGWTPLAASGSGPYVSLAATGIRSGSPITIGSALYTGVTSTSFTLDADLSPTGVPSQVRCFLGGAFVASGPFQTSGRVGDVVNGSWPTASAIYTGSNGPSVCMAWAAPVSFKIRGDVNPTTCDSVAIVAVSGNVSNLSSVQLRFRNMAPFQVDRAENEYFPHATSTVPAASGAHLLAMALGLGILGASIAGVRKVQRA